MTQERQRFNLAPKGVEVADYQLRTPEAQCRYFTDRLKTAILSQGLSVTQLAKRMGCSRTGLSNIINGKALPSVRMFFSIIQHLGIKLEYYQCRGPHEKKD